jgi:nitroreductase
MMSIESEVLRAIIRERAHHTVEGIVYLALESRIEIHPSHGALLKHLLDIWRERGLPLDPPDIQWAVRLLELLEDCRQERKPEAKLEYPRKMSDGELNTVDEIIYKRRSIRSFTDEDVPKQMIEKIVEAGLWAPSACNLQAVRALVVESEEGLSIFRKGEVGGAPIYVVICQDYRPYEFFENQIPLHNRDYDAGAAAQNMLLMAHALGLGAVWLTFSENQTQQIRELYRLPSYMHISTFIGLGWPSQGAIAPGRIRVKEAIIG